MGKAKLDLEPRDTTLVAMSLTHLSTRVPMVSKDALGVLELIMDNYKSGTSFTLNMNLNQSTILLAALTLTGSEFTALFDRCHTLIHKWDVTEVNPWEERPEMVPAVCIEICVSLNLCRQRIHTINQLGLNPN